MTAFLSALSKLTDKNCQYVLDVTGHARSLSYIYDVRSLGIVGREMRRGIYFEMKWMRYFEMR